MTISGLGSLLSKMKAAPDRVKAAGDRECQRTAASMAEHMRASVPRDTGSLAASIRAETQPDGSAVVSAGGTAETARVTSGGHATDEALLTEYGTSKSAPQPFIRPAFEDAKRDFRTNVERAVSRNGKG